MAFPSSSAELTKLIFGGIRPGVLARIDEQRAQYLGALIDDTWEELVEPVDTRSKNVGQIHEACGRIAVDLARILVGIDEDSAKWIATAIERLYEAIGMDRGRQPMDDYLAKSMLVIFQKWPPQSADNEWLRYKVSALFGGKFSWSA